MNIFLGILFARLLFSLQIQRHGLLTYVDFSFLLNILSTPRRYLDIAFHAFDVSADGNCEAKVKISNPHSSLQIL